MIGLLILGGIGYMIAGWSGVLVVVVILLLVG